MKRAGLSWRLLVHDALDDKDMPYGKAHHITSTRRHEADQETREDLGIADKVDELEVSEWSERLILPGETEFDELVVDHWIHIEEMHDGYWWMNISGVTVHVAARKDGTPKRVSVHMPGGYADPEPRCQYFLDDRAYELEGTRD